MAEIPLSIVAWVSVVLLQAVIHYVILGARRGRIQEEEDMVLEECLSLSTTEGSTDASDEMFFGETVALQDGYKGTVIPPIVGTPPLLGEKDSSRDNEEKFMELLAQTGTDLFRRRSVERIVEEQVRARAQ
eukprot:CAMPEP_0117035880 /NCGR_PEP_ID=MMETSP0472-20121206/25460_1 /TAXON_ID=693140 ORGANISM="Tiarina fusus, Strain LIS" /NCGR_SAMPLE_ID=MMETSP0472 /ASSEMBLY_ACC=CAM_ASM_000603 /LENGTH=130 /DNA_ID=CAMNT_0004745491 /DNA_START=156 /DNA_END=548 /DNA_ORIENTATION=-